MRSRGRLLNDLDVDLVELSRNGYEMPAMQRKSPRRSHAGERGLLPRVRSRYSERRENARDRQAASVADRWPSR